MKVSPDEGRLPLSVGGGEVTRERKEDIKSHSYFAYFTFKNISAKLLNYFTLSMSLLTLLHLNETTVLSLKVSRSAYDIWETS